MFKTFLTILLAAPQAMALSCACDTATFTNVDISAAIYQGRITNSNPTKFGGKYPHHFGNREGLNFPYCDGNDYVEYPLKQGRPYIGGPPGADRVVFLRGNVTFCGCMTHHGAPTKNGFVACRHTR